jgi:inner membrane protein
MASRDDHDTFGCLWGAAAAAAHAILRGEQITLPRLFGGAVGGVLGARMPDAIEPAKHPHHRQAFHSVAALGVVTVGGAKLSNTAADVAAGIAATGGSGGEVVATEFLVGFATGLPAGYASHLAADAGTPRGIPLLGRLR